MWLDSLEWNIKRVFYAKHIFMEYKSTGIVGMQSPGFDTLHPATNTKKLAKHTTIYGG